jgi:hypothetical protein
MHSHEQSTSYIQIDASQTSDPKRKHL